MLPQTLKSVLLMQVTANSRNQTVAVLIKQDTANSQTDSVLLMQVTTELTSQCMATTYACYLHAAGVHPMHGHATRRSHYSSCHTNTTKRQTLHGIPGNTLNMQHTCVRHVYV